MKIFRSGAIRHGVAPLWLLSYCCSILLPLQTFALTSGPSQPEMQSFTPATTSDMVDLFTGDFKYNIPLMDVGGYPLNLAYSANITPEEEASWVGLGWSLNTGAVTRNLRGLPDDFSGDKVAKHYSVKPNQTFGVGVSVKPEIFGFDLGEASRFQIGLGKGAFYNTYTGFGTETSISAGLTAGQKSKGSPNFKLGINASANSEKGLDVSLQSCFEWKSFESERSSIMGAKLGLSYNSRAGLKQFSFSQKIGTHMYNSMSSNTRITFGTPTYTPQISMPMRNISGSGAIDFGTAAYGVDIMWGAKGYYSEQRLEDTIRKLDAYGYLYAHKAGGANTLYDINREKDGSYTQDMKNLPLTNFTYDVFNVDAHGCNGSFRAHRGDVGIVSDPITHSPSYAIDITGPEIALGVSVHGGIDIKGSADHNESGRWNTAIDADYKFRAETSGSAFEPYYFKNTAELVVDPEYSWFGNDLGGFQATSLQIAKSEAITPTASLDEGEPYVGVNIKNKVDVVLPNSHSNKRNKRAIRGDLFYFLNAKEASKAGVLEEIPAYDRNAFGVASHHTLTSRTQKPEHHISEVSVVKKDGKKYVFGVPVYNNKHEELTFNVSGNSADETNGIVSYTPGRDETAKNNKGIDHFYSKTSTPAYAHSFLLSAVLSSDYKDVDEVEGPSDGDLGAYVKINHTKAINAYKWRTPYGEKKASFNNFLKNDPNDDKGSIIYGEKEIWYTHSIETATQIAEFYIAKRLDGYDVANETGGMGDHSLYKLDSIKLYDKANRLKDQAAVAIKTVHFVYDYSLCHNTPNSKYDADHNPNKGKLTLKRLYFTYDRSKKGAFNPYIFSYSLERNYDYALSSNDRWGNYKENKAMLTNADFPYVIQDTTLANQYSAAWTMEQIQLPTGGVIKVQYEADDYAYVQDKRAMQMFKVLAAAHTHDGTRSQQLYGSNGLNSYLFFEVPNTQLYKDRLNSSIDTPAGQEQLKNLFFGEDTLVYFNFSVNVKKGEPEAKESVPGYFTFKKENCGFKRENGQIIGYVKMNEVGLTEETGNNATPITKAAVQFARIYMPREVYDQPEIGQNDFLAVVKQLFGFADLENTANTINTTVNGENQLMVNGQAGCFFDGTGHSFIRLYNPISKKIGGGHRVKRITLDDSWAGMTENEESFAYGQEYEYTTWAADNQTVISSGVAAYEPFVGGEENPFRQPVFYKIDKVLAPSETYYHEEPFGESFFPAPSVGYSKVTVRPLQYANVKSNATGYIVNEFYTAKDFPVFTQKTPISQIRLSPGSFSISFLKISADDIMTVSQGYYVETNDMHGKTKGVYMYAQGSKAYVSATEYKYRQKQTKIPLQIGAQTVDYTFNRLDNEVVTLNKTPQAGSHRYTKQLMGVDYDMVYDFRSNVSDLTSAGALINLDCFIIIFPILIPAVYPSFDHEHTEFNSAVATKVIRRSGIIESITQNEQGSVTTVNNEIFDPHTGEALLSRLQNQYDDSYFNFSYPAYWAYDGMEASYQNIGRVYEGIDMTPSLSRDVFNEGDELLLGSGDDLKRATVVEYGMGSYIKAVYDDENNEVTGEIAYVKVIGSGKKNQLDLKMGQVTTMSIPQINGEQIAFENVLNVGSLTYANNWSRECMCDMTVGKNPLLRTLHLAYYPEATYVYVTERTQSSLNQNLDLSKDGIYQDFAPFWLYNTTKKRWDPVNYNYKWNFTSSVNMRNGHGEALQTVDFLGRASSSLYGYGQTLPTAIATNTPLAGMAFDNFEAYEVENCEDNHFNFKKAINSSPSPTATPGSYGTIYQYTSRSSGPSITNATSHSGKYSIVVPSGSTAALTKQITTCPMKPVKTIPEVVVK